MEKMDKGKKKKNFTPNYKVKPKKSKEDEEEKDIDFDESFPTINGVTEFPIDSKEEKIKKKTKSGGFQAMGNHHFSTQFFPTQI